MAQTAPSSSVASAGASSSSSLPQKSNFKEALSPVPVPQSLMEGINVMKVDANGRMKRAFLTLSEDKFTIYITQSKFRTSGGVVGVPLLRPLMRKVRSIGTHEESDENESTERAVDIGAVDRIQRGQNTLSFEKARRAERQQSSSTSPPSRYNNNNGGSSFALISSRSFSIIFRGERTIDLMTEHDVDRDEILDALDNVIKAYKSAKLLVGNDVLLLRYIWLDVDKDKSNTINASELGKVLGRINFYMKKAILEKEYDKFAKMIGLERQERRKGLSFEQCVTFLHKIKRDTWQVKPVNQIWNDSFGEFMNNGKQRIRVSADTFLKRFLIRRQGEKKSTLSDVHNLFRRLNQLEIANVATTTRIISSSSSSSTNNNNNASSAAAADPMMIDDMERYISKDHFEAYLMSRENDVFDPVRENFDPLSMCRPLSEYWINTSHNTYLKGDQFTSQSSVEMYMNALYRGCRCVEIDIWDGDRDSVEDSSPVPIVTHGRTMTTKIPFSDIIKAIKVFLNFNPNSFPIILSLENHCSIPYQEVMAEQLLVILGSRLYVPDEASLNRPLPSPESLRGMVVLKGRRPLGAAANIEMDEDFDDDDFSSRSDDQALLNEKQSSKIAPQLARLTLFHGVAFKKWPISLSNPPNYMHSFSESKVRSHAKRVSDCRNWIIYNQSNMTRTFPSGSRIDSSNYNPMLAWSTGCQMVALNFQTSDAFLRINDGRFRENGSCGYVPKPTTLMAHDEVAPVPIILYVRILSGSCLPKPKGHRRGECIDPYVKVSVFDVDDDMGKVDSRRSFFTTNIVGSNGFFPIWNQDKKFQFIVENGTVAVLQITVWDKDVGKIDDFIASASIPISCLRQGYRSVQLFDENNTRSGAFDFASLLVEVKMRRAQEDEH